jgi:hypothetical protein
MVAGVQEVAFSVVWSWTYADLLQAPYGSQVSRDGSTAAFDSIYDSASQLELPWDEHLRSSKWDRFWSSYLVKPDRMRHPSDDVVRERLVPLVWRHGSTFGPGHAQELMMTVYLHPHSVTVVANVVATGSWPIAALAQAMCNLRGARDYSRSSAAGTTTNRHLDGLAAELRDEAVRLLCSEGIEPGAPDPARPVVVVAPLQADANPSALSIATSDVMRCVVGLSVLGPPGTAQPDRLHPENADPRRASRVYQLDGGHVIWNADAMCDRPESDPILCLQSNHTAAIMQVLALGGLVKWAANRVAQKLEIPTPVQPIVQRAVRRLAELYDGNPDKTYRSIVLRTRIEAMRPDMIKATS